VSVIVSNNFVASIDRQLDRFALRPAIATVLAYRDEKTQFKEPKGEMLRRALAAMDVDRAGSVIVGDTVEEKHIGDQLGLPCVAITGGYASEARLAAERPAALVHSYRDMRAHFVDRGLLP
jgi:phosphoglycolate phosphatase-like HAD superfamily hydrolase